MRTSIDSASALYFPAGGYRRLVEPWVMTPRTLTLNPNPEAGLLPERGNCEAYELGNISTQIRRQE